MSSGVGATDVRSGPRTDAALKELRRVRVHRHCWKLSLSLLLIALVLTIVAQKQPWLVLVHTRNNPQSPQSPPDGFMFQQVHAVDGSVTMEPYCGVAVQPMRLRQLQGGGRGGGGSGGRNCKPYPTGATPFNIKRITAVSAALSEGPSLSNVQIASIVMCALGWISLFLMKRRRFRRVSGTNAAGGGSGTVDPASLPYPQRLSEREWRASVILVAIAFFLELHVLTTQLQGVIEPVRLLLSAASANQQAGNPLLRDTRFLVQDTAAGSEIAGAAIAAYVLGLLTLLDVGWQAYGWAWPAPRWCRRKQRNLASDTASPSSPAAVAHGAPGVVPVVVNPLHPTTSAGWVMAMPPGMHALPATPPPHGGATAGPLSWQQMQAGLHTQRVASAAAAAPAAPPGVSRLAMSPLPVQAPPPPPPHPAIRGAPGSLPPPPPPPSAAAAALQAASRSAAVEVDEDPDSNPAGPAHLGVAAYLAAHLPRSALIGGGHGGGHGSGHGGTHQQHQQQDEVGNATDDDEPTM